MHQYVRDLVGNLFIHVFFSFGYKELKVGREYKVDVFNGFINAWFDYDYVDIWEWLKKEFFLVFFITIFPEEAQNEDKVAIKTTFILMMKTLKARSPTQIRFRLRRDERIFLKSIE